MLIEQAKEIIKSAENFSYFCDHYLKILNSKTIYPLNQSWQKRLGKELSEHRYVISIKWRDGGIATTHLAYCLWLCLFHENKNIFWLENRKIDSEHIACNFDLMLHMLPTWMFHKLDRNGKSIKQFPTKSQITFTAPEQMRNCQATHVVINDAAYIKDIDTKWPLVRNCLTPESKCYITSSVKEGITWFCELYQEALLNRNEFHIFESHYTENPVYQNAEYVKQCKKNLGEVAWLTEVEGNFCINNKKQD
jgi:hypothetical protein